MRPSDLVDRVHVVFGGEQSPATLSLYGFREDRDKARVFVRPSRRLEVKWKDEFEVRSEAGEILGHGVVLYPSAPEPGDVKANKRKPLLDQLALGEGEMLQTLAEIQGLCGLRWEQVAEFAHLSRIQVEALARGLEEEGKVRILSFSPLFLIAQESLEFLRRGIASYLARYHKKHPGQRGAPLEKIEKRLAAPRSILVLAVKSLIKEGRVVMDKDIIWLADFRIPLSATDEKTLVELETMILEGKFAAWSLEDIRTALHLSLGKLQTLLAILMERKKIVEGRDGFLLHSKWLDEIVKSIRDSGKDELTVADFKTMTGLSRKYAIPLLELLDEMGVTRRKGAVRDILR
jgi:selenocysteine-specific elongation factor